MRTLIAFVSLLFFLSNGHCDESSKTRTVIVKGSIGVKICGDTFLEIDKVFEGKPAWIAGLRTGDLILSIDGQNVSKATFGELIKLIKGEAGRPVSISVKTKSDGALKTYKVVREDIAYEFPS